MPRRRRIRQKGGRRRKKGGFLPLLPLILSGLGAAGSLAGGAASIARALRKGSGLRRRMGRRRRRRY